ncbi:hypothetical protein V6R21_20140 [Limibacter armeniacum]|uniref:hypothetical protein n=1 Tax=Limibacter armeniacum TaxID=466084 RepID=UPI002FE532CD
MVGTEFIKVTEKLTLPFRMEHRAIKNFQVAFIKKKVDPLYSEEYLMYLGIQSGAEREGTESLPFTDFRSFLDWLDEDLEYYMNITEHLAKKKIVQKAMMLVMGINPREVKKNQKKLEQLIRKTHSGSQNSTE